MMDIRIELDNSTKFDSAENILSRNGYYEPGGLISGKVIVLNRSLKPLDIHKGIVAQLKKLIFFTKFFSEVYAQIMFSLIS